MVLPIIAYYSLSYQDLHVMGVVKDSTTPPPPPPPPLHTIIGLTVVTEL